MNKFSARSRLLLDTCHPDLIAVFERVIQVTNIRVIEGYRERGRQEQLYRDGFSKVKWPNSKHNRTPSYAVDVVPYPVDWSDRDRFVRMAGIVEGVAFMLGIPIRWGGNWDGDDDLDDQTFMDLAHFELRRQGNG